MKQSEIAFALNTMSQWLVRKDIQSLADVFLNPLPVYAGDKFILLRERGDILTEAKRFVMRAHRKGIKRMRPNVVNIEDQSDHRSLVLIEWTLLRGDGSELGKTRVRYVFRSRTHDERLHIEMIELIDTTAPHLCVAATLAIAD